MQVSLKQGYCVVYQIMSSNIWFQIEEYSDAADNMLADFVDAEPDSEWYLRPVLSNNGDRTAGKTSTIN